MIISQTCNHKKTLLKTDHDYGYIIESIPDVYNAQIAKSIKWFYEAKIIHFWHFRKYFTPNMDFSPFFSHQIYRELKEEGKITEEMAITILNCKSSFRNDSMICGADEINLIMHHIATILWKQYQKKRGYSFGDRQNDKICWTLSMWNK